MQENWLRVAHRGASGTTPEHTRAAFERAVAMGVDMIELDVQLSRDEELVVLHDLDLDRTSNGHGRVRDYTLKELKQLDTGSWFDTTFRGEPVLSLAEVIDIIGPNVRLNTEVKAPQHDWPALVPRLLTTLRRTTRLESTIVSCFEPGALLMLREQNPGVCLGLLWQDSSFTEAWRWAREIQAVAVHPFWMFLNAEIVAAAHARNLRVVTWTVNDVDAMRSLLAAGVDGIISDFPERFSSL